MLPYWKAVIIIIALLFVQAWCDLSLPAYTSDIIDVGIQNNGVEHVVPEKMTADEFDTAQFIMTDKETNTWKDIYEKKDDLYELKDLSNKELIETRIKLTGMLKSKFFIQSCLYQTILVKGNIKTFTEIKKQMEQISKQINKNPNLEELEPEQVESLRIILEILNTLFRKE